MQQVDNRENWGICYTICLMDFPGSSLVEKSAFQFGRHGFDPWVRKLSWTRKWQPTPVFLPGEFHGQKSLVTTVHGVTKELDMI